MSKGPIAVRCTACVRRALLRRRAVAALAACGGGRRPASLGGVGLRGARAVAGRDRHADQQHPAADDRADHARAGQGEPGAPVRRRRVGQRDRPRRVARGRRAGRRRRRGGGRRASWPRWRRCATRTARRAARSRSCDTAAEAFYDGVDAAVETLNQEYEAERAGHDRSTRTSSSRPSTRSRSVADAAPALARSASRRPTRAGGPRRAARRAGPGGPDGRHRPGLGGGRRGLAGARAGRRAGPAGAGRELGADRGRGAPRRPHLVRHAAGAARRRRGCAAR